MNTVEELRRAWTQYYAYGPDEHEARFEANSKLRGPKQVWKPPLNPNSSASSYFWAPPDRWGLVQAYSDNH